MTQTHGLGFPRIGLHREGKRAVEAYWKGEISQADLLAEGQRLRKAHWDIQAKAGLNWLPVNDFSWYDHVLDWAVTLGVVPTRFGANNKAVELDTVFRMARGRAPTGEDTQACEMTKWFDTNYHYIVPELDADQNFRIAQDKLFTEVAEAQALGHQAKPVILGPLSFLWLAKAKGQAFDKLVLLDKLVAVYQEIFTRLASEGVTWVQIDEPILVLDLPQVWQQAFQQAYAKLSTSSLKLLLTTYFGGLEDNLKLACQLPVAGLHIDLVRAPEQLTAVLAALGHEKILSVGVVDGRNIWRTDLNAVIDHLQPVKEQLGDRLWISSSCSLLHSPVDVNVENKLDSELKSWLAFATQKVDEIATIATALDKGRDAVKASLTACEQAFAARVKSSRIHNPDVKARVAGVNPAMSSRQSAYEQRAKVQSTALSLPMFPTTTIGSFPQTTEIRQLRRDYKAGVLTETEYEARIKAQTDDMIARQEALGLDVLVHGEAERNDMVEYFGELLQGFAFTANGWVQSYGSRCVKPPIIYGDVARSSAMTVEWSAYAQSKTKHYMKGMLTGPVTILSWSFVRDDQPRSETALQIALALRDEVTDLEQAGIRIIQIDEPAFREGLPLRRSDWQAYLEWAVNAFRISASGVKDETQIHTHMCYAEFNDIIDAIAKLDADVITMESSRSQMELLEAFVTFEYPNEIGPGVYDIHSPVVPTIEAITGLMDKAVKYIPAQRLWVNPDCGLKTRGWPEVEQALQNMVAAAKLLRIKYDGKNAA